MKKYFIILGICLAVGISLNVNLQWNHADVDKLGITMSNIEALASGENQGVFCTGSGSLDCPTSIVKVLYIIKP